MDIKINIEDLRRSIASADENSLVGEEFAALINHPNLTRKDLIEFLRLKLVVGEFASFRLHRLLGISIPSKGPFREQNSWYKILEDKQIKSTDFVHQGRE